jgi:type I restriction enzyme S subunit
MPPLVRCFDRLAGASDGVARLRDLILTGAVQGKLLPQSPSDEPATNLLQRIAATFASKATVPRIALTLPGSHEEPFALPANWAWVRFGEVAEISGGVTLGRKGLIKDPVTRPYLRVANVQRWHVNCCDLKTIAISSVELARFRLRTGDLLITEGGDWDKVGRTAIWRGEVPDCLHQNHVFRARGITTEWNPAWAELFLNSPIARAYFAASAKQTTNLASINMTQLKACAFPVPPFAEQARIVARVDELMRLCDALEKKGRLEAEQHARLLSTLLGTLTDSATPEELAANWQRVAEHFDLLLDRPEAIDALEQTVLQLAIRGLLVSHRQEDDPATPKPGLAFDPIGDSLSDSDSVPFELPRGWRWQRLGDIAIVERGGSPRPIQAFLTDDPDGLNWIKIGDTDKGGKYITSAAERIRPEGLSKTRRVFPGDFLLTNSMSFGRPYITLVEGCIHDGWLRIRPPESLNKDYLYFLLSSPFTRERFVQAAAGGVVQNLNADKVRDLCIPVPPTSEQERIASEITHLFSLCATLRERLQAQQATQSRLAEALVDQALDA